MACLGCWLASVWLAVASLSPVPVQGQQATNSLLNDLRAIPFPGSGSGGTQPQSQGFVSSGGFANAPADGLGAVTGFGLGGAGGIGMGGFGSGVGMPSYQPATPAYGTNGGIPVQQLSGTPLNGDGGGTPLQQPSAGIPGTPLYGFGGSAPTGFGGFGQPLGPSAGAGFGQGANFGVQVPQAGVAGFGQQQNQVPPQSIDLPLDFKCATGPRAATWQRVKMFFRSLFSSSGQAPQLPSREMISAVVDGTMKELTTTQSLAPQHANECGLGKLCLQVLTFALIEDPSALARLFSSIEEVSSPVLTMLLDVPWTTTAQSGWPLFGLLGLVNARKMQIPNALNSPEIDGITDDAGLAMHSNIIDSFDKGDTATLLRTGAAFISALEERSGAQNGNAISLLAALAAAALGSPAPDAKLHYIQDLQTLFKRAVGSALELDVAVSTNWPLWAMIHSSLDGFAVA